MFTAVTAEFNPFHKGHEALMNFAGNQKDSEGVIVILSSNFTQRGLPSLTDKFTRAFTALRGGAEIVIELPFLYACSAGENFARGAAEIIGRLGFVSRVVFGVEDYGFDIGGLARAVNSEGFGEMLRAEMRKGVSYSKAFSLSAGKIFDGAWEFLTRPNNTLALSYMTALQRGGYSGIECIGFPRVEGVNSGMIREDLSRGSEYLPEYSVRVLDECERAGRISDCKPLWGIMQYTFIRSSAEELRRVYGIDEGIEGLVLRKWRESDGFEDFVGRCVCARYTRAHIRRRLVYLMLGLERSETERALNEGVPYARVLGFTGKGRSILREYRKRAAIPVITGLKYAEGANGKFFAETERRASMLYELTMLKGDMSRESNKVLQFA